MSIPLQQSSLYQNLQLENQALQDRLTMNEAFFSNSIDLLAVLNFNGEFVRVNDSWAKLLDCQMDKVYTNPFWYFIHKDDQKKTKQIIKEVKEGLLFPSVDNRIKIASGDYKWYSWQFKVNLNNNLIFAVGREITAQKKTEDLLKFQLEFEELIAHISTQFINEPLEETDSIIQRCLVKIGEFLEVDKVVFNSIADDQLRIQMEFGWTSEPDKQSTSQIICLKDYPWAIQNLQKTGVFYVPSVDKIPDHYKEEKTLLKKQNVVSYLSTLIKFKGLYKGYFYISTKQKEKRWNKDSIALVKVLGQLFSNALERKQMLEVLQKRTDELERSNKELEQFAYAASHDLKEPLRMISSYVQLLKHRFGNNLDSEAEQFITFTVDGVKRMKTLIDDLLAYSRISRINLPFVKTDLNEVVIMAMHNLQSKIKENKAKIKFEHLPAVEGDTSQMLQLFQNLIDNAIKFRTEKKPMITISYKERSYDYLFMIKDNGIGIESAYKDKIFKLFQRLNNRGNYEGNGIGLTVCKRIIERHKGEIWFESKFGSGTIFHFTIHK